MVIRGGHMLASHSYSEKANKNSPAKRYEHMPHIKKKCRIHPLAAAGNTRVSSKRVFFPDLFLEPLAKKLHRRQIFVAHFFQIGVARRLFLAAANIFTLPAEEVTRADGRESPGAKSGLMRSCSFEPRPLPFCLARRKNFHPFLFSSFNSKRWQLAVIIILTWQLLRSRLCSLLFNCARVHNLINVRGFAAG